MTDRQEDPAASIDVNAMVEASLELAEELGAARIRINDLTLYAEKCNVSLSNAAALIEGYLEKIESLEMLNQLLREATEALFKKNKTWYDHYGPGNEVDTEEFKAMVEDQDDSTVAWLKSEGIDWNGIGTDGR